LEALEGFGDGFVNLASSGIGRLDDGKRLATKGQNEGFAGVADFLEKSEAVGFKLGNLERFHVVTISGHFEWSIVFLFLDAIRIRPRR